MPVSVLDSRVFRNLFGTAEIRNIFEDTNYVSYLIDVETALARVQSKLGVIPADETINLREFFPEDGYLKKLFLDDQQTAKLDRL